MPPSFRRNPALVRALRGNATNSGDFDVTEISANQELSPPRLPRLPVPDSPLRILSAFTLAYLGFAALFLFAVGTNPLFLLYGVISAFPKFLQMASVMAPVWLLFPVAGLLVGLPALRRRLWENRMEIVLMAVYCSAFTLVFGLVKNHMSIVVPYWADNLFTRIDLVTFPHRLLAWLEPLNTGALLTIYFNGWVFLATFFPVILSIADPNLERRRAFTILWAACWVVLGNVVALVFMSAGPIFLDRLPGAELGHEAYGRVFHLLARDDAASLLRVKEHLWGAYANGEYMVGSGISAFPSVHVGMATVLALYLGTVLASFARRQGPGLARLATRAAGIALPVALVLVYLVLSVYLGWHYAIDGYVSIALMCLFYALLRRFLPPAGEPGLPAERLSAQN